MVDCAVVHLLQFAGWKIEPQLEKNMKRPLSVSCALVAAAVLLAAGCAMDAADAAMEKSNGGGNSGAQCYGANDCPPGYYCNEFKTCSPLKTDGGVPKGDAYLPPEVENEQDPPAAGKRYVYVAVAKQNMVVKIDSESLQVRSIKVGHNPGALRTVKGQDVAVVLNRGSATASVLRSKSDGSDEIKTLKTAPDLNNLAVAPDGKYAVAFFDVARSKGVMASKQTLQDVTLIRLEAGKESSVNLTAGFLPSKVQFASDSSRAFVVTEKSISIIDPAKQTKPSILPTVPLLKDALSEPKPDEVLITPDGKLALLRQAGVKGIRAVDLTTKVITDLALSGEATDLDLTQKGAVAVAVLRQAAEVALIDVPGDITGGGSVDSLSTGKYTAGQATITPDGSKAYLYTNATAQEVLLIADLATRRLTVHPLQKGVRAVYSTPDSKTALVVHNKISGTPSSKDGLESYIDKSHGYSLVNLALGFSKLLLTDTDPGRVAFAPDSRTGYLTLSDASAGKRSVEAMDLASFQVKSIALNSSPVALGVIASTRQVYVPQSHHLGRVTFIDITTLTTKTVTGFELNSQVIE